MLCEHPPAMCRFESVSLNGIVVHAASRMPIRNQYRTLFVDAGSFFPPFHHVTFRNILREFHSWLDKGFPIAYDEVMD